MTPCWIVLLDWWRPQGRRPRAGVFAGVALGMIGTLILIGPGSVGGARIDSLGALVALLGTLAWAAGSMYARSVPKLSSSMHSSAIQMMTGGVVVLIAGLLLGEFSSFHLADVSLRSALSMVYLILVGSLIGFTAYMYLLDVTSPALAATYAFVNPVVAVLLGTMFAGEQLSPRIVSAGAVIVGAVALITLSSGVRRSLTTEMRAPVQEAP
jgi:drug/metabolite transporter (DMT)-like permease